jgi:RecA-family ATPase
VPSIVAHNALTEKEIRDAIQGAYKFDLKPTPSSQRATQSRHERAGETLKVKPYEHDGSREEIPADEIKMTYSEFLKGVLGFRDGEYAWFAATTEFIDGERDGEQKFSQWGEGASVALLGENLEGRVAVDDCSGRGFTTHGSYFAVNPFRADDKGRKTENVSRYLYTLVESDRLPREEQLSIYRRSKLPIVSVIDSGGKSVHAIVKVAAADSTEYARRVRMIHDYLGEAFDATIDPVRFSRLPNSGRDGARQRLLEINIGYPSWEEWESGNIDDGSETFELDSLMSFDRANDPDCLIGDRWLCKSGSLVLQGPTGVGKSSLMLQMLMSWAIGRDFFGIKPVRPLRVCLLQAENDKGDMAEPFQDVAKHALKLTRDEFAELRKNLIIKRNSSSTGGEYASCVRRLVKLHNLDIIFGDPLFAYAGGNVSDQEYMSKFLRAQLEPVCHELKVIVAFVHHTGKPPKQGEGRTGSKAYAGFGSSEIANWAREVMTIDDGGKDGIYTVELSKRQARTGLVDIAGNPTNKLFLRHSNGGTSFWLHATDIENTQKLEESREQDTLEKLRAYVEKGETVGRTDVKGKFAIFGYTARTIDGGITTLLKNTDLGRKPIYLYKAKLPGGTVSVDVLSIHPKPTKRVSNSVPSSVLNSKHAEFPTLS